MSDPIKIMQNEMACMKRQITGCSKNCIKCDLVLEDIEVIAAYEAAIEAMGTLQKVKELIIEYENRFPYRVPGDYDSYSSYREGMNDFIGVLYPMLWPDGRLEVKNELS